MAAADIALLVVKSHDHHVTWLQQQGRVHMWVILGSSETNRLSMVARCTGCVFFIGTSCKSLVLLPKLPSNAHSRCPANSLQLHSPALLLCQVSSPHTVPHTYVSSPLPPSPSLPSFLSDYIVSYLITRQDSYPAPDYSSVVARVWRGISPPGIFDGRRIGYL